MNVIQYVHGVGTYTVTGADPEGCINRLSRGGIRVWDLETIDPLTLRFSAPADREQEIHAIGERAYCTVTCTGKRGLKQDVRGVLRRPVLLLSVLGALILSFFLEEVIWRIRIDIEEPDLRQQISHVLSDMGVSVWTRTDAVEPLTLRYALLNRIPELSWVAVNPKGGKLTILALPKDETNETRDPVPGNLVACRDGVITDSVILEGMALIKPGQSVKAGQILVSGVEDYGLYLKAVEASGEIYGQTWHGGTLITPSVRSIKQYTGRSRREYNLIVGRKFINLSGSSSILGGTCDKMIDTEQLSLPGYPFPLCLQRVTYREYTITEQPLPREQALALLSRSWESCLLSSMVAGRVEKTDSVCFEEGGLYIFCGESICHELLSRFMELEPLMKGEDPIGTDH